MAEHSITDPDVRSRLAAAYLAEDWPLAYSIVLDYMATTPDPIFTPALKFWFQGAIEINSDAGTPVSEFVRTYTKASFALLGEELNEAQLQDISDLIAATVIGDILGVNTPTDPTDDWKIMDLPDLIQHDVGEVLSFEGGNRPLAAWGGTPFAETKLGLTGWLDQAITSGEDLRIFFESTRAAIAAAAINAFPESMLNQDGDTINLLGVVENGVIALDDEVVGAVTARHLILAGAAGERVVAVSPGDRVVAVAAEDNVGSVVAIDLVIVGGTDQQRLARICGLLR